MAMIRDTGLCSSRQIAASQSDLLGVHLRGSYAYTTYARLICSSRSQFEVETAVTFEKNNCQRIAIANPLI